MARKSRRSKKVDVVATNGLSKNKTGMVLGVFVALLHIVWALLVGVGVAQTYLDWILPMHFIGLVVPLIEFSWLSALILAVLAFIGGYVIGWLFAALWNCKCMNK